MNFVKEQVGQKVTDAMSVARSVVSVFSIIIISKTIIA